VGRVLSGQFGHTGGVFRRGPFRLRLQVRFMLRVPGDVPVVRVVYRGDPNIGHQSIIPHRRVV
jgi:hypothetical protein